MTHEAAAEMTASERARLIRETWRAWRNRMGAKWDWRKHNVLVIPAPKPLALSLEPPQDDDGLADDRLEFRLETHRLYPDRAYRILCEGIIVEQGPLEVRR